MAKYETDLVYDSFDLYRNYANKLIDDIVHHIELQRYELNNTEIKIQIINSTFHGKKVSDILKYYCDRVYKDTDEVYFMILGCEVEFIEVKRDRPSCAFITHGNKV